MAAQPTQHPRPYNNGFLPNGAPPPAPVPGAAPLLPNQGRIVQQGPTRILCVADVRGHLRTLNQLAKDARADYIIHTGDFGFYDDRSLDRIADKTLKHVAQYSPLISEDVRRQVMAAPNNTIKERIPRNQLPLSELPQFLSGQFTFDVPVYTVWGACEDVQVLERIRSGEYNIKNLYIVDENKSRLLDIGGVKLRLLGLGGAVVMHKLFDNGEGRTTIAGGQGTMWTTLLQMGELIDTAQRVYDPSETRVLITHASPAREGLLNQLSVTLKVDFSISAGLHFRYGSSYNEFSVNPSLDHYRGKLAASKSSFQDVWETVKSEVEPAVADNEAQKRLLANALDVVTRMPSVANGGGPFGGQGAPANGQVDESAFKNMWNFNLADAAFGWLVLEVDSGRIGTEMKAQGFNFSHRGMKNPAMQPDLSKVPAGPSPGMSGFPNTIASSPATQMPPTQPRPNVAPAAGPNANQQAPQQPSASRPNQPARPVAAQQQTPAARQAPPAPTTAQPQQPQTPQPKPAPQTASQPAATSAKPQPSTPSNGVSSEAQPNGNGEDAAASKDAPSPATAEKKPSQGIFVQGTTSEDEVRNLFSEADRAKIERVENKNNRFYVAHFNSPEEMQSVYRAAPQELKKPGGNQKVHIRVFEERSSRGNYGAGGWGSSRGGAQAGGYRSGGASDSEGGRGGRGGSFRGRGRGDGARGGRGRGGRGGFNKGPGEGGPGSPAASPAPAA